MKGKWFDWLQYLLHGADATLAHVTDDSVVAHILAIDGDVSDYNDTTDSLEALSDKITALTGAVIVGSGTLTTSSATVPADTSQAAKATGYFKGCLLMPLTGVCAYQPKLIVQFTTATGVFTLNAENPFTAAPGLVAYVIVAFQQPFVPTTDGASNQTTGHVVGGKADTPVYYADLVSSVMRYLKGILKSSYSEVKGVVTTATSTTQFADLGLAGFGNGHFVGWWVTPTWDAGGAAAAPQGEWKQISAYVSATGLFTHAAFSAQLATTDKVKVVSPEAFEAMIIRGGAVTLQDLLDNQQAMLDVARGTSGAVTVDGGEDNLYNGSAVNQFVLLQLVVDLNNMTEGDSMIFKVYTTEDGVERKISDDIANTFNGAQDPARVEIISSSNEVWGREGIRVCAVKNNGTSRAITAYWRDAKRGG